MTQGRYREAEPLLTRALAITERTLGPNHPEVGRNLNNLGMFYLERGRFSEAEPIFKRVLAIVEESQGSEHRVVASTLTNLAAVYLGQGRYADAEPLFQRALSIREKALGPDHPDVGMAAQNLAWFYQSRARLGETEPSDRRKLLAEAERLYLRALAVSKEALDPRHATVGTIMNDLNERLGGALLRPGPLCGGGAALQGRHRGSPTGAGP